MYILGQKKSLGVSGMRPQRYRIDTLPEIAGRNHKNAKIGSVVSPQILKPNALLITHNN